MKVVSFNGELQFSDGSIVRDVHEQDCCESVYADWEQLKDTDILSREFDDIEIEKVPDSGFRVNGYFVPCYNEQNGYYSSDLQLEIYRKGQKKEVLDISECVEDHIY